MRLAESEVLPTPRQRPIRVTPEDAERLRVIIERHLDGGHATAAEALEYELARAEILPQKVMPADVVTMRSRIIFEDVATGKQREAVLAYPEEADVSQGRISVLAP